MRAVPVKHRCEARTLFGGGPGPGQKPQPWTRCMLGSTQLAVANGQGQGNFCRIHARMWRQGRLLARCTRSCGRQDGCVCSGLGRQS